MRVRPDGARVGLIEGDCNQDVDLSKYKGKVVMVVNVASECGLTGQYKPLQRLHEKYKDQGFVIIGVPALRIPGLFLAVATLAFAVPVSTYLLSSIYFPALTPARVPRPPCWRRPHPARSASCRS